MNADITKSLWKLVWLKIYITSKCGDPRSIASRKNKEFQKTYILSKMHAFGFLSVEDELLEVETI